MSPEATYNGTNLRVFMDGELLGGENECSISFSHDPRDAATKDSGRWDASEEGKLSCEISASGFVAVDPSAQVKLFDAYGSSIPVQVQVGTKVTDGSTLDEADLYYEGNFRVTSFEDAGKHQETRTFSISLKSTGPVVRMPEDLS